MTSPFESAASAKTPLLPMLDSVHPMRFQLEPFQWLISPDLPPMVNPVEPAITSPLGRTHSESTRRVPAAPTPPPIADHPVPFQRATSPTLFESACANPPPAIRSPLG